MLAAIRIIIFSISSKTFSGIPVIIFNDEFIRKQFEEDLCEMFMKRQVNVTTLKYRSFLTAFKRELNREWLQMEESKDQRAKQTWVQDLFLLLLSELCSTLTLPP